MIGDSLEAWQQSDFFRFFNLEEEKRGTSEGRRLIVYRPSGPSFRALVHVDVAVSQDSEIAATALVIRRSFVDDRMNAMSARDVVKSFLQSAPPKGEAAGLRDLIAAVWQPVQGGRPLLFHAESRPFPSAPEFSPPGYDVFAGLSCDPVRIGLGRSLVDLAAVDDAGAPALRVMCRFSTEPAIEMPSPVTEEPDIPPFLRRHVEP